MFFLIEAITLVLIVDISTLYSDATREENNWNGWRSS